MAEAQKALAAANSDFKSKIKGAWGKLIGAWGHLLWSVFAGGLLSGFGLFFLGYWLGKHL